MNPQHIATVNQHAMDIPLYADVIKRAASAYQQFRQDHADALSELNFFRLHARHERRIIAANRDSLAFVETLAVKPPNPNPEIQMERLAKNRQSATADTRSGK